MTITSLREEAEEPNTEEFVRALLWNEFPECCGQPVVGAEYMGQQEMICCGNAELALLSDAQIVASLRERFTQPQTVSEAAESIGMQVEGWVCYGMPTAPLTPAQRSEIREFAQGFEECDASHDELVDMDDHFLIRTAYQAMAEYARGQM